LKSISYLLATLLLLGLTGCSDFWDEAAPVPAELPEVRTIPLDNGGIITQPAGSSFKHLVLLVPLQGERGRAGQAIEDGFLTAYNSMPSSQRPGHVEVMDTSGEGSIQQTYQRAVQQGADFIIGPLAKADVQALAQNPSLPVPTLTLNYLEPNQRAPTQLYQFGLSPFDEIQPVVQLAWQRGQHRALIIVPSGNWGQSVARAFQDGWQALGGRVVDTLFFTGSSQDLTLQIQRLLHFSQTGNSAASSRRHDFDMIFLVASPENARQIRPLLKFYYAGDVPVYATSLVYSGVPNPQADSDLNGITFCDMPWVLDAQSPLANLRQRIALFWPVNFRQETRLYALGVDAYQVASHFPQLVGAPNQGLPSATGTLSVDNQYRVVRQLVCAQFVQGKPRLLNTNNG